MRRFVEIAAALTLVLAVAVSAGAARRGTARGTVTETNSWKAENGQLMLSVTIEGEGPWHATFSVGPGNRQAYATVGLLKKGEHVVIGWVREDDRNWIREIAPKGAEREEAEEREGDERTERPDRERDERAERKEGERDERAERKEGERDERAERKEGERDERAERKEGDRERGEAERRGPRRGSARGTVAGLDDHRGENGRVVLTVTLAGEGDRRTAFRVGEGSREAFERAKRLKRGDRVTIGWVAEGDQKWIREIGRTEGERTEKRERGEGEEREHAVRRDREHGERETHVSREGQTGLKEGERKRVVERGREKAVEAAHRDWTKVTVISVVAIPPGGTRMLTVIRTDNGKPMIFKIGPDRAALYESVGKLLPGRPVLVVFAETEDGPRLQDVGEVD